MKKDKTKLNLITRNNDRKFYTRNGETTESKIKQALPHKYPMELNKEDMLLVLKALHNAEDEDSEMLFNDILFTIGIVE